MDTGLPQQQDAWGAGPQGTAPLGGPRWPPLPHPSVLGSEAARSSAPARPSKPLQPFHIPPGSPDALMRGADAGPRWPKSASEPQAAHLDNAGQAASGSPHAADDDCAAGAQRHGAAAAATAWESSRTRGGKPSSSVGPSDGDDDWLEGDGCQQESSARARERAKANGRSGRELLMLDPKKVRRIMANRQSAAKSKERKQQYTEQLNQMLEDRAAERDSLAAQLERLQADDAAVAAYEADSRTQAQALAAQLTRVRAEGAALLEQLAAARRAAGQAAAEPARSQQPLTVKAEPAAAAAVLGPVGGVFGVGGQRSPHEASRQLPAEITRLLTEPVSAEDREALNKAGMGAGSEAGSASGPSGPEATAASGGSAAAHAVASGASVIPSRAPVLAGIEEPPGRSPDAWASMGLLLQPEQLHLQPAAQPSLSRPVLAGDSGSCGMQAGGSALGPQFGGSRAPAKGLAGLGPMHHRATQSADQVQMNRLVSQIGILGPAGGTSISPGLPPSPPLVASGQGTQAGMGASLLGGPLGPGLEQSTSTTTASPSLLSSSRLGQVELQAPASGQQSHSPVGAGGTAPAALLAGFGPPGSQLFGSSLLPGASEVAAALPPSAAVPMDLGSDLHCIPASGRGALQAGLGAVLVAADSPRYAGMMGTAGHDYDMVSGPHGLPLLPQMQPVPTRQVTTALRQTAPASPWLM